MASSFGYVGNPDYRGYLNYLSKTEPGSLAGVALNLVGNDATYDPNKLAQYAAGPGGNDQSSIDALKNYINSTYNTYQGYVNPPSGGGGTTGGATGPDTTQAQNNLRSALSTADTSLASGNQSQDNQYQSALQQLLVGRNQSQAQYNQGTQTNATNYVGNKNTIGSQAGSALNSLLRLLGSRGAGGSAVDAARQAVARGATLQRNDAATNFGSNQQGLDTGWSNYLTDYNNQVTGVGAQRDQNKAQLANSIASQKASLLQTLAGLQSNPSNAQPYLDQANALLNQSASYVAPQINYQTQAYTPASIASYTATPQSASLANRSGNDYFSPYLSTLLGKKQPGIA